MRKSNWKNVPRVSASIGEHTFQHSEKVFLDRIQFLYVFYAVIDSFILFVCLSIHLCICLFVICVSIVNQKRCSLSNKLMFFSLTSIVHVCSSGLNIVYIPYRYAYMLIIGQELWLFNMSNRAGWKSRLFQSGARIYFNPSYTGKSHWHQSFHNPHQQVALQSGSRHLPSHHRHHPFKTTWKFQRSMIPNHYQWTSWWLNQPP